jgi:hypothetical protein
MPIKLNTVKQFKSDQITQIKLSLIIAKFGYKNYPAASAAVTAATSASAQITTASEYRRQQTPKEAT